MRARARARHEGRGGGRGDEQGCARRVFSAGRARGRENFQKKMWKSICECRIRGCPAAPPLLRLSPALSLSECARARALLLFCALIGGAGETLRAATSCTRSPSKPPPRASAPRRRRNGAQPGVRLAAEAADDRQFWCALCSDAAAVAAAAAAAAAARARATAALPPRDGSSADRQSVTLRISRRPYPAPRSPAPRAGVGKTCLLLRYANDTFSPTFITTIGAALRLARARPPPPRPALATLARSPLCMLCARRHRL